MRFPLLLIFSLCLLSVFGQNCSHVPVCAVRKGKYRTFPNACEAASQNFSVVRQGPCFKKVQEIDECTAYCEVKQKPVCGEKDGKFRSYINLCWANCSGAAVVSNNSCEEKRELAFEFVNKFVDAVKNAFKGAERWIENKTQTAVGKTKQVWHQIGEKWEECNCEPFNDMVSFMNKVVNDTKRLANMTVEELKVIERNTVEGFYLFKKAVKDDLQRIKNATVEAAKKLVNRTKEFFQKVGRFIKNVTEEAAEWIIEEGHSLRNKTATWWHRTKDGIENCTCCLIEETEEVLDKIAEAAQRAANKTAAKLQELRDRLRKQLIRMHDKGEESLNRTKAWFESLWPCVCPNNYEPVCVETPQGDRATILNKCFADCPRNGLKIVGNDTCEALAGEED